jgi:PAS domain S-box-containing protein
MFDRRTLTEYGLAVGVTLLALLARFALDPFLGDHYPFVMFWVAVAVTTWFGGLGASLMSIVLGGLAADWFFVTPRHSLVLEGVANHLGFATYLIVSFMIVGFGQAWQRARLHADVVMEGLRREVIEHKQAEARFRTLAENMSQLAWMTDQSGEAVWFNRRWFDYTGTDLTQMRGMGWTQVHHPDHVNRVVASWQRGISTGEPWEETFPLRGHDGQYRWFLTRAVPIGDEAGAILRWFGTNTDITEIMKVETALRNSEERYRKLYESIDEGFCVIHVLYDENQAPVDYVFLEVNPAFEKQTGLHSARGRRMREIAPEHEQHWFDLYGHVAMTGEPRRFEYPAMQLHRWYEGYAYRFGKPHERKVGIIFNDITERKASQTRVERFAEDLERQVAERTFELVASQEQLRALTTELNLTEQRERMRLATELHDYLAQMLVLAGMKLDQAKQSPPARSLDFMDQADQVLNKCLSYTRTLVAELSPPVLHEFGLSAALRWLGEQMSRYNLAVTVRIHTAEEIALPEDQAILLFQSVRELLLNTTKHAHSPHASVVLDHVDGRLRIVVQDDGVGFDPAAMKSFSISQKFGLFSIRERMRALGGTCELHSAPGKGATATLILPFRNIVRSETEAIVHARGTSQPETVQFARQRLKKEGVCRVLIVDDHALMRQGLRSLLDSYADLDVVGEAADGEEAVRMVAELCPSIVIMDINMPKMNGIEATKRITAQYPTVAVIGLSVNAEGSIQDVMKQAGAATLLPKVAAVQQLYVAIQDALKLEHRQANPLPM